MGQDVDTRAVTAILARVSSDQGGRSDSVFDQLTAGRKAAAELGWPVAAEYDDDGISASRFALGKMRPGWQALIAAIEAGTITRVILWAPNRASREMAEWSAFLNLCRQRKVLICAVSHGSKVYDTANARDRRSLLLRGPRARVLPGYGGAEPAVSSGSPGQASLWTATAGQTFVKSGSVVDIVPGSELEHAYGGSGNLSAVITGSSRSLEAAPCLS